MLNRQALLCLTELLEQGKTVEVKTEYGKVVIIELGKRQVRYHEGKSDDGTGDKA